MSGGLRLRYNFRMVCLKVLRWKYDMLAKLRKVEIEYFVQVENINESKSLIIDLKGVDQFWTNCILGMGVV